MGTVNNKSVEEGMKTTTDYESFYVEKYIN